MAADSPFDFLYSVRPDERIPFGDHWVEPEGRFKHGEWYRIAVYDKDGGDGQAVEVDVMACPARFYRIRALVGTNSMNEPKPAFEVTTGSSMAKFAAEMAAHIADGMIGVRM